MKKLIKNIFSSILFSYRNILNWVLFKIIISSSSYLIWIIIALPFLLIAFLIIYISPLNLSNFFIWWQTLLQDAIANQFYFILVLILFVFTILSLFMWINYKRILLAKLNFKYIEGEKFKFSKNDYFNFKLFYKYAKITLIFLLIVLLFFISFWFLLFILTLIFWWIAKVQILISSSGGNNPFSIISLILAIIFIVSLIYTLFRIYFSYFILLDNKDYSALDSIKSSIKNTKWFNKLFKLLTILIMFFILLLPVNYLGQYIVYNSGNLANYIWLKKKYSSKETKNKLTQKEFYKYSSLDIEYWNLNNKELLEKYNKNNIIELIFFVIHFLLIFWIIDLVLANFYKKEIK